MINHILRIATITIIVSLLGGSLVAMWRDAQSVETVDTRQQVVEQTQFDGFEATILRDVNTGQEWLVVCAGLSVSDQLIIPSDEP